jgi:hypothetical protein
MFVAHLDLYNLCVPATRPNCCGLCVFHVEANSENLPLRSGFTVELKGLLSLGKAGCEFEIDIGCTIYTRYFAPKRLRIASSLIICLAI